MELLKKTTAFRTIGCVIMLLSSFLTGSGTSESFLNRHDGASNGFPAEPEAIILDIQGTGVGPIPDGTAVGPGNWGEPRDVTFDVPCFSRPETVRLVIYLSHTWIGDLEVILAPPGVVPGQPGSHVIFSRIGATSSIGFGDSSNFNGGSYGFSDTANTTNIWTFATATSCGNDCNIPNQDWRTTAPGPTTNPAPYTSLNVAFANLPRSTGKWTLRFRDGNFQDTGVVILALLHLEAAGSPSKAFDFDSDYLSDVGVFRPSAGEWWIKRSTVGTIAAQFGSSTDRIVPADFTGDGRTDMAVWRPESGEWFVLRSGDYSYYSFPFGSTGDIPVPAHFDGDAKSDPAVFRPSTATWFIQRSLDGGTTIRQFGTNGDVPVPSDYDGDGRADIAIYRPSAGQWWLNRTTLGNIAVAFGNASDKPVEGDYTGDGKSDVAFWRPSTGEWFVLRSDDSSFYSFPFGTTGDIPAPAEYDRDMCRDPAVFRPSNGTWYALGSKDGLLIQQFGTSGDRPIPSAYIP